MVIIDFIESCRLELSVYDDSTAAANLVTDAAPAAVTDFDDGFW